jgi:hypothetical protein
MAIVLDAGALIAIDRRDRSVIARLVAAHEVAEPVRTSAAAVAQVWRNPRRQATLAMVLRGVQEVAVDSEQARAIGRRLAGTSKHDVVDAGVALMARRNDQILTSDPGGLKALVRGRGVRVIRV